MRLTRKTMVALGVSGALTVMAGVSASAAVLGLPILGFGEAASESAAPPQVVHRTVYDDHYVTATTVPKPAATPTSAAAARAAAAATAAPAPAAAPAAVYVPAPAPAPAPAVEHEASEVSEPPATAGRPPVPAGCEEPEWDSEHQAWHCKDSEGEHDD